MSYFAFFRMTKENLKEIKIKLLQDFDCENVPLSNTRVCGYQIGDA